MKELEKNLKALANRRRLEILKFLKYKQNPFDASVGIIAEHIKLSFKSTSRHLAILKAQDIIEISRQENLHIFYKISANIKPEIKTFISML
jgi:DNA-binding transcriptional ArsR family regulator